MNEKYKVYKYTFPDGKIYIGMTKNSLGTRRDYGYNHNKRLKEAIKETGWRGIEKSILADGLSQEEAFEVEKAEIEKNNATDENVGYNISHGGKSTFEGLRHTDECKRRMSEMFKGKGYTPETIERMIAGHEKERKKVIGITGVGEKITFRSLGDAAQYVDGYRSNISRACTNGKSYKGMRWCFANEGR